MRKFVSNRWFALVHFLLVIACGVALYSLPNIGLWPFLFPLAAWAIRLVFDRSLLNRFSYFDGLLAVFLITAAVGYWAAYNQTAAWDKLRLIIAAIFFYHAISTQPKVNLAILALFWFVFGVGVATYFLLSYDFESSPTKFYSIKQISLLWMTIRPAVASLGIHPNGAAGVSIITSVYGLYFLRYYLQKRKLLLAIAVLIGLGIVFTAVLLAASRGAFVALATASGSWLLWRILRQMPLPLKERMLGIFPHAIIALILLIATLLILPLKVLGGPFSVGQNVLVSRMELLQSGISILNGFPFTGGGLESFPGLYSQYVLVIPYYSILHSHNMFLDAMIEQGLIGGICFLVIFLAGTWQILSALTRENSDEMAIWYWLVFVSLFVTILHGMVDDYIYGGKGTVLAFFPIGMAVLVSQLGREKQQNNFHRWRFDWANNQSIILNSGKILQWGIPLVVCIAMLIGGLMWKRIVAQWIANIGSVKMAKIELARFPANRWDEGEHLDELSSVEVSFERALSYDAENRLANHRLGLIKMQQRDFKSASIYLLKAYEEDPSNRGLIKNLGYCYVWLGELDKAQSLLAGIPEAQYELNVYVWWWRTQGRTDLAKKASLFLSSL